MNSEVRIVKREHLRQDSQKRTVRMGIERGTGRRDRQKLTGRIGQTG